MTDLSILRKNFNKLIDSYEEQDITIEQLDERAMGSKLYAALLADQLEKVMLEGNVDLPNKHINELFKAGLNVGFTNFFVDLAKEDFMEEQNGQGTVKE